MSSESRSRKGRLGYLLPGLLLVVLLSLFVARDQWLVVLVADFRDNIESAVMLNRLLLLSLWCVGTWFLLSFVRIFFWEGVVEQRRGEKVPILLTNLFRMVVVLIAGVFVAITVFQLSELSVTLLVGGSAAFVAVFFRDFLAQLFAGLSINLDQGIDIGANLLLPEGTSGVVEEMHWRSVSIRLADGSIAIVPNTLMAQSVVKNLDSLGDQIKVSLDLTLDFSLSIERAERVLNAALVGASRHAGIVDVPMPQAFAKGPGTFGVNYELVFSFHGLQMNEGEARSRVTTQVMKHLKAAGLSLALPKQNVFVGEARMTAMSWYESVDRELLMVNISLFDALSGDERKQLAEALEMHQIAAGDEIIREGDTSTSMYGLAEGVLEVSVANGAAPVVVAVMEPGSFFGEMSMLADDPRSATVTALVDSLVFELHREDFKSVIQSRTDIAESISRLIVDRQMSNDEALKNASDAERNDALTDASTNLLDRIRSVFSLFRFDD